MAKTQFDGFIDEIMSIDAEIKAFDKEITALKKTREDLKERLIKSMDAAGTDQVRNDSFTATLSEVVVPQVTNWDRFYTFIHKNKAYYMLERRAASVAFRDTLEERKGRKIPGVESYTKRSVGIRKRPAKR